MKQRKTITLLSVTRAPAAAYMMLAWLHMLLGSADLSLSYMPRFAARSY